MSTSNFIVALLLMVVVALSCIGAHPLTQQQTIEGSKVTTGEICEGKTPCGWGVYTPLTRRIDYFMKNQCDCPPDNRCLMTSDDLSAKAYVYQCRVLKPS